MAALIIELTASSITSSGLSSTMRPAFILFALAAIVVARPPEAATNAAALITDTKELALANNIDTMVEKAWQDEGDAEDWGRRRRRRRRFRKSLKKLIKKLVGKAVKDALKDNKPKDDKSDGDKPDKPDAPTSSDSATPDPTSTDASSSDSAAPDPTAAP